MATINILDSSVFNLIAAGEVVERPASIIKELVENSIDAHASTISVEVYGGGIEKIIVTDNGSGIEKDQLKKAFLPHATSKIKNKEDLVQIFTLGFRGEALPSISSVSKVTIESKPNDQDVGYRIFSTASEIGDVEPCSVNSGTCVTVEDVFYNVPARAKFLKKPKQEENEITTLMAKLILTNPSIAFRFFADGKMIYQSTGLGVKDALFCVYGKNAINETLEVNYSCDVATITGVLGKPSLNKPNRTYQTIIVNGRFVNSQQISFAVANALEGYLMKRQYPFFVYYLTIPTESVDVNVHPNKLEVRFSKEHEIYSAVYNATSRAINQLDNIAEVNVFKEPKTDPDLILPEQAVKVSNSMVGFNNTDDLIIGDEINSNKPIEKQSFTSQPEHNSLSLSDETSENEIESKQEQYVNAILGYKQDDSLKVADGFGLGSSLLNKLANISQNTKKTKVQQEELLHNENTIKKVGKLFNTYLILEDSANAYFIDQHAAHERLLYEKFKSEVEEQSVATQPLLAPYILQVNANEKDVIKQHLNNLRDLGFSINEFGAFAFQIDEIPLLLSQINFNDFFGQFLEESKNNANFKKLDLVRDEIMQLSCKSAIKGGDDLTDKEIDTLYTMLGKEKIALFCPHGRPIVVRITKNEMDKWFKRIV